MVAKNQLQKISLKDLFYLISRTYQQSVFYGVLFSVFHFHLFPITKQLKTQELKKLESLNEIEKSLEILGTDFQNPTSHPKYYFDIYADNSLKISCRTIHRKAYFSYFVISSTILLPWCFEKIFLFVIQLRLLELAFSVALSILKSPINLKIDFQDN